MNRNESRPDKPKIAKTQQKKTFVTSLNLVLILVGIMVAIFAVLYWRNILNPNTLWKADIVGLGVIFIILSVRYYLNPAWRSNFLSRFILGIILISVGLLYLFGFNAWWPVSLFIGGLGIVISLLFLRRETEKRKVTLETLREKEIINQHIVDNANCVIIQIDRSGKIKFINKFALDFFGYREVEILGQNLLSTIMVNDSPNNNAHEKMIEDIAINPGQHLHDEKQCLRKNGEKAWITWTYKPIFDEYNDLKEILCIGIDRTEQKKAEELAAVQIKEQSAAEERTRLARDLHDAVSQTLFSLSLMAEVLPKAWEKDPEDGRNRLQELRQLTRGALAEMRTLLFELRPGALINVSLAELLRQLTEAMMGRAGVLIKLEIEGTREIPVEVKIALYRIAQEALNNISKHSGTTRAQVTLRCEAKEIDLHIIDNGHGFDISKIHPGSFGLGNMKERANQIGASLNIDGKIDEGTEILVVWRDDAEEKKL
jgi:PAS domain S-box-containing protein